MLIGDEIRSSSRDGLRPLLGLPEQCRESLFAIAAEIDDAAARRGVARRPVQLGEPRHDRGAQRSREMMPALAPVQARLADRAARMGQRFRRYRQRGGEEPLALGGQLDLLFFLAYQTLLP